MRVTKKNAYRSSRSYLRQSSRSGRHRFVRTRSVGCSLAWTPTSTCSSTNQRSRASTWTGTSRAPMPSSNPATFTSTKCSPAPSGARASRDTQVRCLGAQMTARLKGPVWKIWAHLWMAEFYTLYH